VISLSFILVPILITQSCTISILILSIFKKSQKVAQIQEFNQLLTGFTLNTLRNEFLYDQIVKIEAER